MSIGLSATPSSSPSDDVLATEVRKTVFPLAGIVAHGLADRLQGDEVSSQTLAISCRPGLLADLSP